LLVCMCNEKYIVTPIDATMCYLRSEVLIEEVVFGVKVHRKVIVTQRLMPH
jgi:hypothetical protein